MKNIKHLLTIVFLSVTASIWAQDSGEIPVPLSDPAKRGKIKVHINYGSITIKGTARKDILVKYSGSEDNEDNNRDRNKSSNREGLRRISSGTLDLEVSENSNNVKVMSGSWSTKINLIVEIPSNMDVQAHTYNDGVIEVNNVQGEVELDNYNGEIYAYNISGSVVATSYNGELKATFDKVTEGTPMSFTTYNGDIDVTFPAAFKGSLKMKTQRGEILTGFDVTLKKNGPIKKEDSRSGTYKVIVDEWVYGDVNGGGPDIIMKNYNGDIYVRKK